MTPQENITKTNIAEDLDEKKLIEIAEECHRGFTADLQSRSSWEDKLEEWTKLALQIRENKTYPWPNASNVKFPLLTTAAMQFAARAYPSLVPNDGRVVKCKTVGADPDGQKQNRASRLSQFMSYQVMNEMPDWEEEMDRLLMMLPIVGCVFKKTYYDPIKETNCSYLVYPKDFVINYWTKSIETSPRYTQIYLMNKNTIQERIRAELFLDQDLGEPTSNTEIKNDSADPNEIKPNEEDNTTPYTILEQHTWLDLDDDGYAEPYVVTMDYNSKKILRISARYNETGIKLTPKGEILRIEPIQYYTKYGFIPNPEGGFYDIGFGLLIGSINESVNTVINQLIDAGSLSNLQTGFIAKGLRIKMGDAKFTPGEWKFVNATGDDLKKSIFPLPVRDPSNVLFQLLGMLVQSGKELASVAEIFVGKMPGQNTPATTTQATIEQGMKLFTAIFKRVYRSLAKEFQKLYLLNKENYDPQKYVSIVENPEGAQDFQGAPDDIIPAADPQATTDFEKASKAENVMKLLQIGTISPVEATKRYLEANAIPDIETLMQPPEPKPDPKQQEMQAKMQMEQQKHQMDMQSKQVELEVQKQLAQLQLEVERAKLELEKQKLQIEQVRMHMDMKRMAVEGQMKQQQASQNIQISEATHNQKMQQAEASHEQKMKQASASPKKESNESK